MASSSRRRVLSAVGGGIGVLAGCLDAGERLAGSTDGDREPTDTPSTPPEGNPPTSDRSLPEDYTIEELNDNVHDAPPGKDGIPSIDAPQFASADDSPPNLDEGDPVFGVRMNGESKAYPQYTLVWHEIVNDEIGGVPVAVTYCPLTGTAQGFYRGSVEFGVSGRLLNTNLVMYDRGTDGWWPQILARGITGPMQGEYLEEFQMIWTTWERWRSVHPDTVVLTEDTGHARNYGRDPYGSYNPPEGYYANERTIFPPLTTDDRFHPKEVVIGARNADGAVAVPKADLRERTIIEGTLGDNAYVSVYDEALDTGYVYRNADGSDVARQNDGFSVGGETYQAGSLPLDRQIAFDAMWLAWVGYYPSTAVHR